MSLFSALCARIEGLADPYAPPEGPPAKGVWAYLRQNLRPLRNVMLMSLAFTAVAASIEVWLVGYAGRLIDTLNDTAPAELWASHGLQFMGVALLLLVLRPISHFAREGVNDLGLRPNAATLFRWRAYTHVAGQSVGWFQNDLSGRTASRVLEVGSDAASAVYNLINAITYVGIYMAGVLILMASADIRLALPILFWVVLYIVLMAKVVPTFERANERFQNARSALAGDLVDRFGNMDIVQVYGAPGTVEQDAKRGFEETRQRFFGLQRVEVAVNILMTVLEGVILVGLVGYAVWLWSIGAASLGLIAAALALGFKITSMAEWFLDAVSSVFSHTGALREALSTVAQPLAIEDAPDATPLKPGPGAISIREVRHHYGLGKGGLDGVSLEIAPGEKVALVGPSGAGKSTLVNLILRFHRLEGGLIEVDGQDITEVTQASLRAEIALVAQSAGLLHRSVRENIAFGVPEAPLAAVEAAAKAAQAHGFIAGLRDQAGRSGYDAHVGERGVRLSGGQRQRIAIARAIFKNAPVLILDEATSALDSEAEAEVQSALTQAMDGKTVIAIAHRLSTIAHMDRIVVLDRGRIVEAGPHRQLLTANGLYARLWARQSGGFIGAAA